jgi:hypothetical protein
MSGRTIDFALLQSVQSTRHVGHASRNVCDNRNVRVVLALEPTRAPRDVSRVTEE